MRPALATLVLAGMATLAGLVVAWLSPPVPAVHDEFSYLLAADTYLQGRLANPTHRLWHHFESMHVIHQPAYASKYPPGQGLVLAAGRLAFNDAIAGVCLATGCAVAASIWMLRAFVPPRWALAGGWLIAMHAGIQLQWGQSYWGGALAFALGAMAIGATARLVRQPTAARACVFIGSGLGLAITRPFEGFVLMVSLAAIVAWHWFRSGTARELLQQPGRLFSVGSPALLLAVAGLMGLGYYNHSITGSALLMPYQVHEATYGATPLFVFQQREEPPTYRHDVLRRYHEVDSMAWYDRQQQTSGWLTTKGWLSQHNTAFFLPMPALLLLAMPGGWRSKKLRPYLLAGMAVLGFAWSAVWMLPHYLAPIAPLLLLLVVMSLRHAKLLMRPAPRLARLLVPAVLLIASLSFAGAVQDHLASPQQGWQHVRAAIEQRLAESPEQDVVLVRYSDDHNVHQEWVYNSANIDQQPVIWARAVDATADAELREYYADREVWYLAVDENPLQLIPYQKATN